MYMELVGGGGEPKTFACQHTSTMGGTVDRLTKGSSEARVFESTHGSSGSVASEERK
jgi:hypothetical protein